MISELAKDVPYMKMVVNLLNAGNKIDFKVSRVLKEFKITHIQFNILRILEASYPKKLSVGDINNGLLFSTSDVTRLLDRLEKRNLISRSLCPDNRRKMDISITDKGLAVIAASLPKIEESLDGYYKNRVTENERDQLLEILKKLKD
jgi:DNA-binding MarR family transcriptional regulator